MKRMEVRRYAAAEFRRHLVYFVAVISTYVLMQLFTSSSSASCRQWRNQFIIFKEKSNYPYFYLTCWWTTKEQKVLWFQFNFFLIEIILKRGLYVRKTKEDQLKLNSGGSVTGQRTGVRFSSTSENYFQELAPSSSWGARGFWCRSRLTTMECNVRNMYGISYYYYYLRGYMYEEVLS